MKMKKFINDPENLTPELLEGFVEAHKDLVRLGDERMVINRKLDEADRVTIVTQGGSGHEPAISGFVGEGMVDISVVGDVFAAPGPKACVDAIKMADKGKGVLYIVLNHAGDMLTGNMTMKKCAKEGLNVVKVVTQEDIGMGQHGEEGGGRQPMKSADETAKIMLDGLLADLDIKEGEKIMLILNGTGATTLMELFIIYRKCVSYLKEKNIEIVANYVGELLTVQEQAGFQMFMARMDDELLHYWNAPCNTPYMKK